MHKLEHNLEHHPYISLSILSLLFGSSTQILKIHTMYTDTQMKVISPGQRMISQKTDSQFATSRSKMIPHNTLEDSIGFPTHLRIPNHQTLLSLSHSPALRCCYAKTDILLQRLRYVLLITESKILISLISFSLWLLYIILLQKKNRHILTISQMYLQFMQSGQSTP